MYTMNNDDLLRLYAKLNAQDILISVCFGAILRRENDPATTLEELRIAALELAERQGVSENDPNPEFAENGRIETLRMVAAMFSSLKGGVFG